MPYGRRNVMVTGFDATVTLVDFGLARPAAPREHGVVKNETHSYGKS